MAVQDSPTSPRCWLPGAPFELLFIGAPLVPRLPLCSHVVEGFLPSVDATIAQQGDPLFTGYLLGAGRRLRACRDRHRWITDLA
jgi:hypothetical protein